MNKALFLDRDGVINIDKGYVYLKEQFEFIDGIFDLCREYISDGYLIIVITNQAGIARGFYTEEDYRNVTEWMIKQFRNKGITISGVYHCPHHPDAGGECECRKPNPGMIIKAIDDFDLDITHCMLIGDKETDLEAGRRAGIPEENLVFYPLIPKGQKPPSISL